MQSNLAFSNSNGFHSDPYKALDFRPRDRQLLAWLTRYNLSFRELRSALRLDYRFYHDDWHVNSHTIRAEWAQRLYDWTISPFLRYYTQNRAYFFSSTYPPEEIEGFYTADQRLSDFGNLTAGIKVEKELAKGLSADIGFQFEAQRSDWKAGAHDRTEIEPLYSRLLSFGLTMKIK